jgi:hypothetical protein
MLKAVEMLVALPSEIEGMHKVLKKAEEVTNAG